MTVVCIASYVICYTIISAFPICLYNHPIHLATVLQSMIVVVDTRA